MPRPRSVVASMLTTITICTMVLMAWSRPAASADASDARLRLRRAVSETSFISARTSPDTYVIVFDAAAAPSRSNWPVTISLVARSEWVLVYATIVDREPGFVYPQALLRRALAYNATSAGAKFALDVENGDLDVQYELPVRAISGDVLRIVAHDVAAACDEHFEAFSAAAAP